jgi:hypothetical protein
MGNKDLFDITFGAYVTLNICIICFFTLNLCKCTSKADIKKYEQPRTTQRLNTRRGRWHVT